MHKNGVGNVPYYFGIKSLDEIATRDDRVCVLNILGTESRGVTPISHLYSGGNIVFGTSPGRSGQFLNTPAGPIPVFHSVKEGLEAGHEFNTGVVYLPPAAVKDGVSELIGKNPHLKKIVIVTEKISVKDSRTIRAICQVNGIDVFGGNCLGVADAWNKVRLGGALGGNTPDESLVKGSTAIFSNSGNFTTTIATYLQTEGWGTTTSISSGKDVYIHYGPKEFFFALENDIRSKGAVLYIEPGGYYEHQLTITKPTIACVVGRWKAKLTHACGHAGSLAGSGDDAAAKERWFMKAFGVDDLYTPERPVFSKMGAVVSNISHIPEALTKVMALNGISPDFEPRGDLSLKCWFANNQGLPLPETLDLEVVPALEPYNQQIMAVSRQVGAQLPRQSMRNASGASMMDRNTHVSKLHNRSILDASGKSLEENLVFALIRSWPDQQSTALADVVLNSRVNMSGDPSLAAAQAARDADASPNCATAAAMAIQGPGRVRQTQAVMSCFIDLFAGLSLPKSGEPFDDHLLLNKLTTDQRSLFMADEEDPLASAMLKAAARRGGDSLFLSFVNHAAEGRPTAHAVTAGIWAHIAWEALARKTISKSTFLALPWHSLSFSTFVGSAVPAQLHGANTFRGVDMEEILEHWRFCEVAFLSLIGRRPTQNELYEFNMLMGLLITNGPGTISAQGCKGGVSADGPEQPDRVQVNKAMIGFLTHTGFAHGGNGFESIAFLLERFKSVSLSDPGQRKHGLDLKDMAQRYAKDYGIYKKSEKEAGNLDYMKIPCINHPIFKGRDVNYDPRERYVSKKLEERGSYNIFLDFYHHLVQGLFDTKVTRNVYCVNVDAVIAVTLLKILWKPFQKGEIDEREMETAAFTAFLYGRMIGCAAEIDDHTNRGRNMDTRTPASKCGFVG